MATQKHQHYAPPFTITPAMLHAVGEISELLGHWNARSQAAPSPLLRRDQRIRSVQATLAIENNSLSVEQVTAVLEGRHVLAPPREVQEVRNAFAAYERIGGWQPDSAEHLLEAHALLMSGLLDAPGQWRSGGVGIYRGDRLVHMAPPAARVPDVMAKLLGWLRGTDVHPLVASCVFHYEFEFIHPFADGNGRIGRLWQSLILSRWQPALAWLPVETVIREQQGEYYAALAASDLASDATAFTEFMLGALRTALSEAISNEFAGVTDQVSDQVSDQAGEATARLLAVFAAGETLTATELMLRLGLAHRPSFRNRYLNPALAAGWIEMTNPDSPRSPTQKYRRLRKNAQ